MNSIQLEYFLSIAQNGSFTAAARKLYISQPALSKQIRLLEEELGTFLFLRLPHGIVLTPEGKKLKEEAQVILERLKNIPVSLNTLHKTVSGELNIVCGNYLSRKILPDLLKRLLARYPSIAPRIREAPAREQISDLINGRADIGIGNIYRMGQNLAYHPMFKSELVLIRSLSSDLANKKKITKEELASKKFISYPQGSTLYEAISNLMKPYPLNVFMESHSSSTIIELVRENFGVAFVPDYMIEPEKRSGIIVGGFRSGFELTISYHYYPGRPLSPQARAFIEVINEKFGLPGESL